MQRSSSYIIMYILILTGLCGVLLAGISEVLKPQKDAAVELERQTFILTAALGTEKVEELKENKSVVTTYTDRVNGYVVNAEGKVQEGKDPKDVNLLQEYKKPAAERMLPVYEIKGENGEMECVVLPLYGYGLWDNVWSYTAIESDMSTIRGVVFDHKGETPGLGARITEQKIEDRYKGKEVMENDEVVGVIMQKGEGNDYDGQPHKVDGLSGATKTAEGLNAMFINYIQLYKPYMNVLKSKNS